MPICRATAPLTPERSATVLAEALRRVDHAIPGPVDRDALCQALETEQGKGPRSLMDLMKVGRRRALDRIRRMAIKDAMDIAVAACDLTQTGEAARHDPF